MKRTVMMAVMMTVGGMGSVVMADLQPPLPLDTGQDLKKTEVQRPEGSTMVQRVDQPVDSVAAQDIRSRLASLVNNAVSPVGYDNFIGCMAADDRKRLISPSDEERKTLNDAIVTFRKDFKNRYNRDFDISAASFDDLLIVRGIDDNHAVVSVGMGRELGRAKVIRTGETAQVGNPRNSDKKMDRVKVAVVTPSGAVEERTVSTEQVRNVDPWAKGEKGTAAAQEQVAKGTWVDVNPPRTGGTVTAREANLSGTASEDDLRPLADRGTGGVAPAGVRLELVREFPLGNPWRVDIPNPMDSPSLKANLLRHVQRLSAEKGQWPNNIDEAYRMVSVHIFQAITEIPSPTIGFER